jgi:hypothetical protein
MAGLATLSGRTVMSGFHTRSIQMIGTRLPSSFCFRGLFIFKAVFNFATAHKTIGGTLQLQMRFVLPRIITSAHRSKEPGLLVGLLEL